MNVAQPQSGFAFYPASSRRVSVTDLSLFLRATMRDGELDGMRVLEEATAQASRDAQIPDINPSQTLTWGYRAVDGERWLAHTGAALGASAIVAYQPDANIGFLIMTNSDAFVLARLGLTDASDAVDAIIDSIAHESRALR